MNLYRMLTALILFTSVTHTVSASDINSDNIGQLQSEQRINFADAPTEAGTIASAGGMTINADGSRIAVRNQGNSVVVWADDGTLVDVFAIMGADDLPDTTLAMSMSRDGQHIAVLASDGQEYVIALRDVTAQTTRLLPFPNAPDIPVSLWLNNEVDSIWLEVTPADPETAAYVLEMPINNPDTSQMTPLTLGADPDAMMRIGRIPFPLGITSDFEGVLKVWQLQTGDLLNTIQLDSPAMFGSITPQADYFAWRDPESNALHLLDIESGVDQVITPLDGLYITHLLLNSTADIILGVHVGDEPDVVAWDANSGEQQNLGSYRPCNRPPDMALLSEDGSTLVIGCDTGLDIWRIQED